MGHKLHVLTMNKLGQLNIICNLSIRFIVPCSPSTCLVSIDTCAIVSHSLALPTLRWHPAQKIAFLAKFYTYSCFMVFKFPIQRAIIHLGCHSKCPIKILHTSTNKNIGTHPHNPGNRIKWEHLCRNSISWACRDLKRSNVFLSLVKRNEWPSMFKDSVLSVHVLLLKQDIPLTLM